MKKYLFTIIACTIYAISTNATNEPTLPDTILPNPKNILKTFSDDFDGDKPNDLFWGKFDREKSAPWSVYICDTIPKLVEVSNGTLKIRAVWDNEKKHPWTGCIQTKDKKSIRYGRVDVRARFNRYGNGAWPAIWMLSQSPIYSGWPSGGEIDIMERIDNEKKIHQAFHQADSSDLNVDLKKRKDFATPINPNKYHVYSMVKLPGKIGLYVDYKLRAVHHAKAVEGAERYWPFETDFYLILNHACSDMGAFSKKFWSKNITEKDLGKNLFPYEMEIDFVYFYDYTMQAN